MFSKHRPVIAAFQKRFFWSLLFYFQILFCLTYGSDFPETTLPLGDCNELNPCENGICTSLGTCSVECSNSTEIFDEFQQKCVVLIGEDCKLDKDCTSNSLCRPELNTKAGVFEGKCRCDEKHYYEDPSQTCNKRAQYGEECDAEIKPCETSFFMECKDSVCQCAHNETQIYDPIKKSCTLRLGADCYKHRSKPWWVPCVQNAECKYFFNKRNPVKCKCAKGYTATNEGFCRASFGQPCNSTSLCHSSGNLVCTDGKCQCDSPMFQIFDEKAQKCVGNVGAHCSSSNDCMSTASCAEFSFLCKCRLNYLETQDNLCKLTFDQECDYSKFPCNEHAGLACKDGKCKCFDSSLYFDQNASYCKVESQGSRCGKYLNLATNKMSFLSKCDKENILD